MYSNCPKETKYYTEFVKKIADQTGKNVVITGTTSGTGFVAACTAISKGASVYMLNRSSKRSEEALKKIHAFFPEAKQNVKNVACDLQDFDSVKSAAEIVIENCPDGIDILCNNAGIMNFAKRATKDGYEVQMQTNVLSAVLLTKLLLPSLVKRVEVYEKRYKNNRTKGNKLNLDAVRVVNHSSLVRISPYKKLEAKYFGTDMSVLGNDGNGHTEGRYMRYHMTKLANSIFTLALHNKLKEKSIRIKSVCAHPGTAYTGLAQATKGEDAFSPEVQAAFDAGQSPEDGSMGILKCMFLDMPSGTMHGPLGYTGKARRQPFGPGLHGKDAQELMWEESAKAVGGFEVKSKEEYLL
eukprot:snap_masked-scaffold_48-processed-gene-0.8-mRNA-1 protein AED:0.02 eAED:0.02 QI:0/-1/0/1/-1/1/1/0/352